MQKTFVILHNVRSAYNVGSIFRTAEAAGVAKLYLTGHTPTPIDRFGRARRDIAKVALGAEKVLMWEHKKDAAELICELRNSGVFVVAVEQAPEAIDYHIYESEGPHAYMFGNEVDGLSANVLSVCDAVIEIPLIGTKESLNVAVAAGIILFNTPLTH